MKITTDLLLRSGAGAAIAGGLSRAVASYIPPASLGEGIEILYLAIDLLLLFGLLAIYGAAYERAGLSGLLGFILAAAGTAMITGPDGRIGGVDMYVAGALAVSFGTALLAAGAWAGEALPWMACAALILSFLLGVGGYVLRGPIWIQMVAGTLFGIGFLLAGLHIWQNASAKQNASVKKKARKA